MAANNLTPDAIEELDECMYRDLNEAASLLLAIRRVAIHIDDDASVELQTMAEKAGYLVDRNIKPKKGTKVVGDYNHWIGMPHQA